MCNLYERIQTACTSKGMTVSAMCVNLGMSKSVMSDLKSGRKKTLSADTVAKIASYLQVSTDYLLNGLYKNETSSFANGITVFCGSSQQELEHRIDALEIGTYRIVFRGPGVVITVDKDSDVTDDQISAVIATYSNAEQTKKAPTETGERSVSDDELMFALWGDCEDIDEDDLEDVRRYAAFVRERKKDQK